MIEFHLDGRSGVSPYLQLVQQVRRALRLGLLQRGRPAADGQGRRRRSSAINPNTVLKAYRELEHDGLVAARPGVGTFVTRTLTDNTLAAHGPLRADLERWLAKARRAGLDDESIEALFQATFRSAVKRGDGMTDRRCRPPAWARSTAGKWALSDCTLEVPAGPGGRPGRPQRRRQEHVPQPRRRDC